MSINKYAVIVAGGSGSRMGSKRPKQFLEIEGKPILYYTLRTFLSAYDDLHAIVVLPEPYMEETRHLLATLPQARIKYTKGGMTRFHSVQNGLAEVPRGCFVAVHDGVRCMITTALIKKCYEEAVRYGNAIPAVSSSDSIRILDGNGNHSIDRERIQIIQTPQTFQSDLLKKGFEQAYDPAFTDEASVVEAMGERIHLVEGDYRNIKVTRPLDLVIAQELLALS